MTVCLPWPHAWPFRARVSDGESESTHGRRTLPCFAVMLPGFPGLRVLGRLGDSFVSSEQGTGPQRVALHALNSFLP